jgi:hypothetical protein
MVILEKFRKNNQICTNYDEEIHVTTLKDRLGSQRGEWIGADKNSSPKRELGLCPKFTTTDSYTSLQGSVITADLPTLGANPKQSQSESETHRRKGLSCPANTLADSPRPWGGRFAVTGQTVYYPRADGPLITTERSDEHPKVRTAVPGPRTVREQLVPRGQSTATGRTVRNTYANGPTNPFRGPFAAYRRTVRLARTEQPELQTVSTTSPTHPWISQTAWALEERFGKMWSVPRGCYDPKLGSSNELNAGNRIATELNQKPRFQPKSLNRRPNSEFGGSRSSTKMHKATILDSHQQIQAQTPQNQRNKPHMKTRRK